MTVSDSVSRAIRLLGANGEPALAIAVICVSLFFGSQSFRHEIMSEGRPGPGFFPLVASAVMAFSAFAILIRSIRDRDKRESPVAPTVNAGIITTVALFAGYLLLIPVAGYGLSTFGFAFGVLRTIGKYGDRKALVVAFAVAAAQVLIFEFGLGLSLPSNMLGLP